MKIQLLYLSAMLLSAGCHSSYDVVYLSSGADSSTPYSCKDFETFWNILSDGQSLLYNVRLGRHESNVLRDELGQLAFQELQGGYSPSFKFVIDDDQYCVTALGVVMKNDELVARSPKVLGILEEADPGG